MYLFASTKRKDLSERVSQFTECPLKKQLRHDDFDMFFFSSSRNADALHWSVINDQKDYSIDEIGRRLVRREFGRPDWDSLVSLARLSEDHFVARTDFWGIQTHYWYHDDDTLVCSDNVFVVAGLLGKRLSRSSLLEYLFFLAPVGSNTWFEDIHALLPDQSVRYDCKTGRFEASEPTDLLEAILERRDDRGLAESAATFFEQCARGLDGTKALVGLSSGSDSRTVLAGLMHFDLLAKAVCFGKADFVETHAIRKLAKKLGIELEVFDFDLLLERWEETFRSSLRLTNGLLNPLRVFYASYYERLNGGALFEGILGSQFVKGEIPVGAVTSQAQAGVVVRGAAIGETIDRVFPLLPQEFRKEMADYVGDRHEKLLLPMSTAEGKKRYTRFLLEFAPSRLFGPLMLAAARHMKVYYPFLSPGILRPLFRSLGAMRPYSFEESFPGPVKCLWPECEIVRSMSDTIYRSVLNRGVSFKEALEYPSGLARNLRRCRLMLRRLRSVGRRFGQVDVELLARRATEYVARQEEPFFQRYLDVDLPVDQMVKEQANLTCLHSIVPLC